ncbi:MULTISPECIES: PRC and DUF2382 domain-containing protein [unclassified Arthrobacter]|uniref:DUF2382 domain-containing protein n=1 Tax=unclassified Arthrobacter TaxID=235627 RepID=UPI0024DF5229|nr:MULTISPECIES: PRC and DUF2382 domain-containing protein [unclassified Arthrobacter]MCC9146697.1 PRC and DUF2382 domain-containing protein [Arthrobacter sp. zg-Y919]MDK1277928.1 PRC and DUF2382 domain-containing protein [Arthrobacter sp. zg.Y919]WIB03478.1 PRC and DUF2382 domain-containing protein [Arthrobacter sp. zg-Y919]
MITSEQIDTIMNHGTVEGTNGEKIGSAGDIYLDDETGQPAWVTTKTGLFGSKETFVPLAEATVDGSVVRVPYSKEMVKDAPRVDKDGHLSDQEQDELYSYYSIGSSRSSGTSGTTSGTSGTTSGQRSSSGGSGTSSGSGTSRSSGSSGGSGTSRSSGSSGGSGTSSGRTESSRGSDHGQVGHDTSGPTTDDAMTRSEEQLHVGTQSRESGRARLRKYVTTENVTKSVPVSHEEARIEREPITDANRGSAMDGPAISEEEHEVTLHAEEAVVEKEAVPVERVRLDTETVTEEATVTEEVSKEQIDMEGEGGSGSGGSGSGGKRRS